MSLAASGGDFVVQVNPGLMTLMLVWLIAAPAGGIVTGLKGRWGWLFAGLVFGGFLWLVAAWLPASPGSWWAGRARRAARGVS
jgi:hypothetical protein